MGLRQLYNVDAPWFDPYETRTENRRSPRFATSIKVNLAVEDVRLQGQLVGPGLAKNISMSGVSLETKHKLAVAQWVTLAIPTDRIPSDLCLATAFVGPAVVRRVTQLEGTRVLAGLEFGDALLQNIEFVMFIDYLQTMQRQALARKS
jgi:hypothetical protein